MSAKFDIFDFGGCSSSEVVTSKFLNYETRSLIQRVYGTCLQRVQRTCLWDCVFFYSRIRATVDTGINEIREVSAKRVPSSATTLCVSFSDM